VRYFKCDTLRQEDQQIVTQDVAMTEEEKKNDRQGKILNVCGTVLFLLALIASFVCGCILIEKIPLPEHPFLLILAFAGRLALDLFAVIFAVVIGTVVSQPIYKKAQAKLAIRKRIYFDKVLVSLREYYGWAEPCIITKCYDASDKAFIGRDICLFAIDDELRLTADLKHGFSVRENDPGCYAFKVDEFSLEQIQGEKFLITRLESENLVFHLGRRAKGFIEKRFISQINDR
jgi:hypothetical protein